MATETTTRPPISEGYTGMLLLTLLAMVTGIGLLVLEATEYDWEQKPKSAAAIALPGAVAKSPGIASTEVSAPAVAKQDEPKPETKPEVAVKPLAPAPVVVPAPVVAAVPPVTGPTPSPLLTPQPSPPVPASTPKPATPMAPVAPTPSPLILPFVR